ncbi:MAG: hypothetical protein ACREYE_12855 [Gammaproteobacteria bacterium]
MVAPMALISSAVMTRGHRWGQIKWLAIARGDADHVLVLTVDLGDVLLQQIRTLGLAPNAYAYQPKKKPDVKTKRHVSWPFCFVVRGLYAHHG